MAHHTPLLFGAFDRHNFGDLLFPHVAAALLHSGNLLFAGLAERDLRKHGGHRVRALANLAAELQDQPVDVIHVGGEILTCDAWQTAVMLLPAEEVQATIAHLDSLPAEKMAWAQRQLQLADLAPYALSRDLFRKAGKVVYAGVGGVELDRRPPAMRAEVLAKLRAADWVSVRDRWTLAHLQAAGIPARLIPDPASLVAELFGERVRLHGQTGEPARIAAEFPQGYIAMQFSADFGDDATLAQIAAQLDEAAAESGLGVAFFRAGAAPWHDDLECFRRIAARLRTPRVQIFESLNVWDICALIARSCVYCGSSLHGRIVAMAFALPRINLIHAAAPEHAPGKQAAYATTWEAEGTPIAVEAAGIASGIREALAVDRLGLVQTACRLVGASREGLLAWTCEV
ncbi:Polysaccharide pyruvyl transferase [Formivibrio citricus]|uniref:Polysaccharide pyruvyl transferase n=1 Tax=Formivibrio citricus TaxID=83765 RepID=A0A1I4XD63_9NEIS|nr:polysaccharide pyruvyl transferase family protein [Formivibrio citricus]SFN23602.1 Polysaccharide pyruvyl transferase [Formivibrio citricus]